MNITVYSSPSCVWCTRAKEYLRAKNINFREVNIAQDRSGAIEMMRKSGQMGVPVLDINGNIIIGFDKDQIDMLLNIRR
jgi:glutaredoxin 3